MREIRRVVFYLILSYCFPQGQTMKATRSQFHRAKRNNSWLMEIYCYLVDWFWLKDGCILSCIVAQFQECSLWVLASSQVVQAVICEQIWELFPSIFSYRLTWKQNPALHLTALARSIRSRAQTIILSSLPPVHLAVSLFLVWVSQGYIWKRSSWGSRNHQWLVPNPEQAACALYLMLCMRGGTQWLSTGTLAAEQC